MLITLPHDVAWNGKFYKAGIQQEVPDDLAKSLQALEPEIVTPLLETPEEGHGKKRSAKSKEAVQQSDKPPASEVDSDSTVV